MNELFRVNVLVQKNGIAAVLRLVSSKIPTSEQLMLSSPIVNLANLPRGLVLVTGPTGSGKSTTLAALVDYVNKTRKSHIVTIEDPLEFVHRDQMSIINQREIGFDTLSFSNALRAALRQDPDVILVGEMRDAQTIRIAMAAAETGHLVFSTLHTIDAKQTVDRIIGTFDPEEQVQVRMQLANLLFAVISQKLIVKADRSGRVAVMATVTNLEDLFELTLEQLVSAIEKSDASFGAVYDQFSQEFTILSKKGKAVEKVRGSDLSREDSIIKEFLLGRRWIYIEKPEDREQYPDLFTKICDGKSLIISPMVRDEKLLGILFVVSFEEYRAFSQTNKLLVGTVASQIGAAIENLKYKEEEENRERLQKKRYSY